jgi:arylsulfatase
VWGGFTMTADIDAGPDGSGVVFAVGDWFGGYALYLVDGRAHFTFARSADILELAASSPLTTGRHAIAVSYALGADGAPGRMVLLIDDATVDEIPVEGMLPVALQHGGAGLRLGRDTGFPVSPRYTPPAPFSGTVHQLHVETPSGARPDPGDEVRRALHAD